MNTGRVRLLPGIRGREHSVGTNKSRGSSDEECTVKDAVNEMLKRYQSTGIGRMQKTDEITIRRRILQEVWLGSDWKVREVLCQEMMKGEYSNELQECVEQHNWIDRDDLDQVGDDGAPESVITNRKLERDFAISFESGRVGRRSSREVSWF